MKITFSSTHNAWSVKAPKGTLISLTGEPTVIKDGVYTVGDDGYILIDDGVLTDSIYLDTAGSDYTAERGARVCYPSAGIEVRAGSSVAPFIGMGSGSGSGGFVMPKFYTSLDCVGNGGRGIGSGNVGLLFNNGGRTVERFLTGLGAIVPAGDDDYIRMNWQGDWEIGVAWKLTREQTGYQNTLFATCGMPYYETPSAEIGSDINRSVGMGIGYTDVSSGWGKWQWMFDVDESYVTQPLKWYFAKFTYDSTNNSMTISYTDDFISWITYTYTLTGTPRNTGYPSSYTINFGAFPDTNNNHHNSDYMRIDLGNTYLKQNGQMVWGNYLGNFPDE